MPSEAFIHERKAAFGDTDAAGIVHFSRMLDYVEEAEHARFFQAGIPPFGSDSRWPRLRLEVDFLAPLRFGDEVQVELRLERIGTSSLTFDFQIRLDRTICARGKWVVCHSRIGADGQMRAAPIPAEHRAVFEGWLAA